MSPFELSFCCSCHVFSYFFAQFLLLKRVKCPPFFVFTTKTTQPHPQVFSVNGALTCKNAAFLMSFPRQTQNSYKFRHQYDDQMMTGYGGLCHGQQKDWVGNWLTRSVPTQWENVTSHYREPFNLLHPTFCTFEVKDEEDLLLEKTVRGYKTGRGKRQSK